MSNQIKANKVPEYGDLGTLDVAMLQYACKVFPELMKRIEALEAAVAGYQTTHTVKMLSVEKFCKAIRISRTTFGIWMKSELFQYKQLTPGKAITIPAYEVQRIETLCKDIEDKQRFGLLNTLPKPLKLQTAFSPNMVETKEL